MKKSSILCLLLVLCFCLSACGNAVTDDISSSPYLDEAVITSNANANDIDFVESNVAFSEKVYWGSPVMTSKTETQSTTTYQDGVIVTLRYYADFPCVHADGITSIEERTEHRNEAKNYYSVQNLIFLEEIGLEHYQSYDSFDYGPFIELYYEDYEAFQLSDYAKLEAENPAELVGVYIMDENFEYEPSSTRDTAAGLAYPFTTAQSDIGIPTTKPYDGTGVKVGLIECDLPTNTSNLSGIPYVVHSDSGSFPEATEENIALGSHALAVYSVLGGTSGIASGATLYFTAVNEQVTVNGQKQSVGFQGSVEWLIQQNVDVVNCTLCGGESGAYDPGFNAICDYASRVFSIVFVVSAGNEGGNQGVLPPSTGVNVISVASSNSLKKIAASSSAGLKEAYETLLLKPTLAAPGASIQQIANVGNAGGTSIAAPMVSGVIAMLMEEFPVLKISPHSVMTLLTNTCTDLTGQTDIVDYDGGFGLINYTNARNAFSGLSSFSYTTSDQAGEVIFSENLTLNPGGTIKLNAFALYNTVRGAGLVADNIPQIKVAINHSGTITYGTMLSSHSYMEYTNTTSTYQDITIQLYLMDEMSSITIDGTLVTDTLCAMHYDSDDLHWHNYSVSYEKFNNTYHRAYCRCGDSTLEPHLFVTQMQATVRCRLCGFLGLTPGGTLMGCDDEHPTMME